ncbi:helix-turn-helix transcriptional regulator [Streptomyces sp. t39]|uniref:helix-turn-helix transcriptional regulator n=1 Tax=Streptomyces sp. t39 TaxID=1828156 RepID=UPI0011CE160E|nr:helix-turn-helix transcriptional regulator [Streptomyces sp. t39]TXS52792.1 XRE family transcriptional regulator [Streptomyces sp. t39]
MARGLADFDPAALHDARRAHTDQGGHPHPLSAARLGELVGATKAQILAYEHGHRTPDPARIRLLAKHLRIRPIDLMKRDNWHTWNLADWRRASGRTAQELCAELHISPKSYRRLEQQGIVPARRPRFLDDVVAALGIHPSLLDSAMDNIPAVAARRQETESIIERLATTYVSRPGHWKGPSPDDPGVLRLSHLYGRPAQRIRRILTKVLAELRLTTARRERERVIADFDPEPTRQLKAEQAAERWEAVYHAELARIPGLLEGFHRSAQPSDTWHVLVALHEVEPRAGASWVPAPLVARPETLQHLPPSMVAQRTFGDLQAIHLTPTGIRHVTNYQEFYAALYPGLRRPRQRTTRRGEASTWSPALFGIPATQERFTVPPHVLERLVLRSNGAGPWDLWLSPTIRLTISAGAGRPTAIAYDDIHPADQPWPPPLDPVTMALRQASTRPAGSTQAPT